jgi:voltage-gated potassium channel
MSIKNRLYLLLFAIFLVIMTGSIGYYILFGGEPKFIDCIYMTVITLTSVGYGEVLEITGNVSAEIFTMVLITFGMGIILYGISTLTAIIIEGELSGIMRKRKMEKQIEKLKDHYIVCGGGETGVPLISELAKNHETCVLVEFDEDKIKRCESIDNFFHVNGDATDDENLIKAGISRAAGIIITLPSDKDNIYITMTARMLNKKMRIITRLINPKLEPKLKKAGADKVVSPNIIGAMRMASEMIRPAAVDFLDRMLRSGQGDLRIHQIAITESSGSIGKKISESGLKDRFDLLVLGAKHEDSKDIEFNPPQNRILEKGMTLIVMGDVDNIIKSRKTV